MKLFGTLIPFIGFREIEVDPELRRFLRLPADTETVNTFQFEWLGCALIIPLKAQ
jgi:hypothetical protein